MDSTELGTLIRFKDKLLETEKITKKQFDTITFFIQELIAEGFDL
ncbi:unnamed protein product [marine sediment metagenome]|uniref:Uncharacterized protein n=1 Tax=marine sediment metagenome TaxID=412755 RepID=X0Y1Z8_9ZZZZ